MEKFKINPASLEGLDTSRYGNTTAYIQTPKGLYLDWGTPKQTVDEVTETRTYARDQKIMVHRDLQLLTTPFIAATPDAVSTYWGYSETNIVDDLETAFAYIPRAELQRLVKSVFWLMKEGLKTHGKITIPGFGSLKNSVFFTAPCNTSSIGTCKHNKVYCGKNRVSFSTAKEFGNLLKPLSPYYASFASYPEAKYRNNSATRILLHHKFHYKTGQILFQQKPFSPGTLLYRGHDEDFKQLVADERNWLRHMKFITTDEEEAYIKEMFYNYQPGLWRKVSTLNFLQPKSA